MSHVTSTCARMLASVGPWHVRIGDHWMRAAAFLGFPARAECEQGPDRQTAWARRPVVSRARAGMMPDELCSCTLELLELLELYHHTVQL